LIGLIWAVSLHAAKINITPDVPYTALPNDSIFINQKGKFNVTINQLGKYHIEQTIQDTVEFIFKANNIIDEKVKNGEASNDTLQVSFKNIHVGRRVKYGDDYLLNFTKDTCNISIMLYGDCRLTNISNIGYKTSFIYVSGSSPSFRFNVYDSLTCAKRVNSALIYGIETQLSDSDSLHFYFNPLGELSTGGLYNNKGHIILNDSKIVENMVLNGTGSSITLKDSYFEANDYSWHNSMLTSKGKLFIENSTLETTNDLTLLNSADTLFINQSADKTTRINGTIGSKRNPLSETKYSRVVVNNASYIREITAMADIYNGHIGTLCPSPQIKDTLSGADVNIYGGTIGFLTNNMHFGNYGSFVIHYGNRIINFYNGKINATEVPIRLGHWYGGNITSIDNICYNDTLNLYSGTITAQKDQCLIRFTDNTCINIHNKEKSNQITRIQYHPQGNRDDNWTTIRLDGGTVNGDSLYWEIGDINNLKSISPINGQLINKQPLRIVYRNSQQPKDSLVFGVKKDEKHYFNDLLTTYNIVDIYHSFLRKITYVNTLDESWVSADTTYREGFGKQKLPRAIYAGKTFKGWYTAPEGGVKMDSISHLQMGDITLYTQWGPGQDIIYSDFDKNILCNTGAKNIIFYNDTENEIISHGRPLEGYDTKAMYCNVTKNNGDALISFYLRDSYPNDQSIYKNAPRVYMDLRSTTGISFMHKGISVVLGIGTKASETASKNKITIPAHETLTLVNIPWGQFSNATSFDLEHVCKMQFKPVEEQGEFWLDNIIFTQGEIYPIEKIQLDTIPNKYLYSKNPNLLDIPLPKNTAGKQLYLYPKFTPSDATYQAIAWSSADTTIVKVDDYGRVSGINHGQTYIYCQSIMQPEVKDSILVGVAEGGIYYDLNGVSISNELPSTYNYNNPTKLPNPEPLKNFYTFHAWHTDSITGAIVDSASYHQFGNLKAHKLFAEFTREIPGAAITLLQNRIVAVQNPYNYDELKTASYNWQYNETPLLSNKMYVEVGLPIPIGNYNVTIYIDDEIPIKLEREINENDIVEQDILNVSVYPNPIQSGGLAHIVGTYDTISLIDTKGQKVPISTSSKDIIKMPEEKGVYILNITSNQQQYNIKMIVM
jgi:hypothetical protein